MKLFESKGNNKDLMHSYFLVRGLGKHWKREVVLENIGKE